MKKWLYTVHGIVDDSGEESFVVCTPRTDGKYLTLLLAAPELLDAGKGIVTAWVSGDLAGAVRRIATVIASIKE